MKDLLTVIYYTSNREKEDFEEKIKDRLFKVIGDLPLISVSQKPINFGKNICVGDVGVSNQNTFRQIQLGAKEAKTPFVVMAEADFLYPRDYFKFVPKEEKCYRLDNVWILYRDSNAGFVQKRYSEGASIYPREIIIRHIERRLRGRGVWNSVLEHGRSVPRFFYKESDFAFFHLKNPAVSIKTKEGMHPTTGIIREQNRLGVDTLPYWGSAERVRKEIFS
jgi:hypothetical protein